MNQVSRMPGIEPLSRVAWQRVESRVFASLDRRERSGAFPAFRPPARRFPRRALVGALAMAASASVLWLTLAKRPTSIEPAASPSAIAAASHAPVEPPGASLAAHDGSRVATTTGPVEVAVGDSVLTISAQSVVQVHGDDRSGWLIQLHRGEVGCHVAPRGQRPPFVVRAGDTTVTVVGTRFKVARADEHASVSVDEGSVRVERAGSEVLLHAGDTWPAALAATSLANTATEASLESERASPPVERSAPRASETSQGLFERAARLEARDPKAALEMYRRIGPRGPWAANALYGRARLSLELGDTARARRDLELYLRRYPRGANAADVRALLDRELGIEHR